MIELLLASSNQHKASEFKSLLDPAIFNIVAASQKFDVLENGISYAENALKKAQAYYQKYKKPVFSDDSGLNVLALPEELGIHSARFGGEGLSDNQRANALLKKMEGLQGDKREAYFSCTLCFYLDPDEIFFFEGRLNGHIAHQMKGANGFGYDPIFHPQGQDEGVSLAMIPEWKAMHSHRANACAKAYEFFKSKIS
ncbi:MAG: non-canonical purine NTP pyrophosphatase [Bacteriovoracaceae bacterium]|nr:non-canonical purine NTP pyrophosphatase [Bacteriovoracaceae bacterium]